LLEGTVEVTSKGIWSAGIVALGALAAFCIWQHAPTSVIQSSPALTLSQATTKAVTPTPSKSTLPPTVTGPTSEAVARMPARDLNAPTSVAKETSNAVQAPKEATAPTPTTTPATPATPVIVGPAKIDPPLVAQAPVVVAPKAVTPKAETTPMLVSPKKKRTVVAKRYSGCNLGRDSNVLRSICFNFNSDRLTAASKAKLNAIIPTLKQGKQFELNGFADAVGNKAYNSDLSERRGKAVLKYLSAKGIDPSTVIVKSFGSDEAEKQKIGKNQRERRVDVRVLP
jgi:outer membrane protein OmpA-like peptidoglycan-associated protein